MRRRKTFLPFSPPAIGDEEIREVVDTLKSDWLSTGPKTKAFEEEFRRFVGAEAALALNSCTAGLHLALVAHGIGPGDEVIAPTMTFCATVNVIEHVGARPVLADIEPQTFTLDPQHVEGLITERTRAIMVVHYGGHPALMDDLEAIARRHGLILIEDAAHALPTYLGDRLIGSEGNLTAFSFYATKNMTTGEGGMLVGPEELVERARIYSLHGMSRDAWKRYGKGGSWKYDVVVPGFKYNLSDIQAALGLWQLRKLPQFHRKRQEIVRRYTEAFSDHPALDFIRERPGTTSAWHLFVLKLNLEALRIDRDRFIEALAERNIGASVHFIPVHVHPYYREKYGYRPEDLPVAWREYQRIISLPLNNRMTLGDADDVIAAVLEIANAHLK